MTERPFFVCLCPTYGRPRMVQNAVACFLAQDYPVDRRRLLILDDAGQIPAQKGDGWEVFSMSERFESLPAKYAEPKFSANTAGVIPARSGPPTPASRSWKTPPAGSTAPWLYVGI